MAKYSYELKLSVVEYYLLNKGGYRSTSNKFQVEESSVRKWIALYRLHGAEVLIKKPNAKYSLAFKRSVIDHMRAHMLSIKQTAAHFSIPALPPLLTGQSFTKAVGWMFPSSAEGDLRLCPNHRNLQRSLRRK